MTTITFQVDNPQDKDLVLALLKKIGVKNLSQSNEIDDVGGKALRLEEILTAEQLESLDKGISQADVAEELISQEEVLSEMEGKYGL